MSGPTVTVPRAVLVDLAADLEGMCTFWACNGPDAPFVAMQTCRVCAAVQDLRKLLADNS